MKFLIVYGTTEGQTRKIAAFAGDRIKSSGHTVTVLDATSDDVRGLKLREFDGIIVAASLHVGMYQAAVEDFVRARHDTLNGIWTAFYSVSLGAASKDPADLTGVNKCVERFMTATSWRPGAIHHIVGAFRYTQYDFFKRWAMKAIAYEKGVSTDASQDLEMTDWMQVASLTDAFVAAVAKLRGASADVNAGAKVPEDVRPSKASEQRSLS
jgi:menaquinone-dependent protoporphyrinogen oxidase